MATAAALAALLPVENVEGAELDSDEEALGESPPSDLAPRLQIRSRGPEAGGSALVHTLCAEGEGPPVAK